MTASTRLTSLLLATAALMSMTVLGSPVFATAAEEGCPPGWLPVRPIPTPGEDGFDSNVSIFAGSTFRVRENAAEAEGLVVSMGDADFERAVPGVYNIGVVGVGSGVGPPPNSDMLIVRGNLRGAPSTTIDVGHILGGNVIVGGTTAPQTAVETNGGDHADNVANAGARYVSFPSLLQEKSSTWEQATDTGVVSVSPFAVTFAGDGTSATQIFSIDGAQVAALSVSRSLQFLGIPAGAAIIINVQGTDASLNFNAVLTETGSIMDPFSDPAFVTLATHTLWNFHEATTVGIAGAAQLPGTILVPALASETTITSPGTNGRVYVGGSLTHAGEGSEMHSYPFLPDDEFSCHLPPSELGAFELQKVVEGAGTLDLRATSFHGTFVCMLNRVDVTPLDNAWSIHAGLREPIIVAADLPVGALCTLQESIDAPAPHGLRWGTPRIEPSIVRILPESQTHATFTLTNVLEEVVVPTPTPTLVDPPEGGGQDELASSGGQCNPAAIGGLLLLMAGAATVMWKRSHHA